MTEPLVSVIMPTYNQGDFIRKSISSVLSQSYGNIELIVVDNYSQDCTEKVVTAYQDNRIRYFKFKNKGVIAASRNFGIKNSKGRYIAFLDSDDIWYKHKIEKQLPYFQLPEIIGVASDAKLIVETPYYRQVKYGGSKLGHVDYRYRDILRTNSIITSSLIVRKKALEVAGLFDEDRDLFCIEDWDLWLRMTRYGLFRVLEEPLLFYRVSRKRGQLASVISKNRLKILNKQVNLDYVTYDEIGEEKVVIYLAIARNLLEFDRHQSRGYYREAVANTSSLKRKTKGYVGVLLSFMPFYLIKVIILFLYKVDKILYMLKEMVFQKKHS